MAVAGPREGGLALTAFAWVGSLKCQRTLSDTPMLHGRALTGFRL